MKIFGIGLPKTGTKSVSEAVATLGFRSVHNPVDGDTMTQLQLGDFRLKVLEHNDAIFDLPAACFYKEYDRVYPGSKFILTTRNKEDWLASCDHWWNAVLGLNSVQSIIRYRSDYGNALMFFKANMFGCIAYNRDVFSRVYDEWHAEAQNRFRDRPGDLCVLDIDDPEKYNKLCAFLDRPVPDVGFPHLNRGR